VVSHRYFLEDDGTTRWMAAKSARASTALLTKPSWLRLPGQWLSDRPAITGNSPRSTANTPSMENQRWDAGTFIESVATLGNLTAGTTLSIQFLGSWMKVTSKPPRMEINSVKIEPAGRRSPM